MKSRELSIMISVAAIFTLSVFMTISVATIHHFPISQLSGENLISVAVLTPMIIMSAAIPRIFFIITICKIKLLNDNYAATKNKIQSIHSSDIKSMPSKQNSINLCVVCVVDSDISC